MTGIPFLRRFFSGLEEFLSSTVPKGLRPKSITVPPERAWDQYSSSRNRPQKDHLVTKRIRSKVKGVLSGRTKPLNRSRIKVEDLKKCKERIKRNPGKIYPETPELMRKQ